MPANRPAMTLTALALLVPLTGCGSSATMPAYQSAAAPSTPVTASSGADAPAAGVSRDRSVARGSLVAADEASVPAPASARSLAETAPGGGSTNGPSTDGPSATSPRAAAAPMLIYTGDVSMAVDNVSRAIEQVIEVAVSSGGFLAARSDDGVQVRVPSARFRDVMDSVEHLGDVTHHDVRAEDVSEQYHDLEVQLANLRAVRARLQEFLTRAANVQDALAVERELDRVAAQIDQIEGRLRFLADRASLSTLTVSLAPRSTAPADPGPAAPDPNVPLPFGWLDQARLPNLLRLR